MSSKYEVISDVSDASTVAANSTNGMTLFNSSDKVDVGLGVASLGIGFVETASLIATSPETGHRAFSDRFVKGVGLLGMLVGSAATVKDDIFLVGQGQDILTGGTGADTARFMVGLDELTLNHDAPIVKFNDFNPSQGDQIDLSMLFDGKNITDDNLGDYLVLESHQNHAMLKLDKDGTDDKHTAQNFIDLGYQPNIHNMEQLLQSGGLII